MLSNRAYLNPLKANDPAPGVSAPRARLYAYLRLGLGLTLVPLFMAAATFVSAHLPALRTMGERIEAYGLRPSAIYYTDYEASGDAAALIRSSLEYSPQAMAAPSSQKRDDPKRNNQVLK